MKNSRDLILSKVVYISIIYQSSIVSQTLDVFLDNTLRDLHILRKSNSIIALLFAQNISSFLKEFCHFALCFLLTKNKAISFPGILGQRLSNLQRAALLTSLVQYDKDSFQI